MATQVFANVPEAANYTLAYELNITNTNNFTAGVPYSVNNASQITDGFDRIGYYLELQQGAGPLQWIFVSADAFTTNINRVGVPNLTSGATFQLNLANMNVASNVAGIATGTGIATGAIEFWPTNYSQPNGAGVPNANPATYDFGDTATAGTHGSMQIHNYDIDGAGPGTTGQTLFAFNNWNNGTAGQAALGIGTRPTGEPDWTFAANVGSYTVKNLAVLVRQTFAPSTAPAAPPALVSNAADLAGYQLVYQEALANSVNYNTGAVPYDVDNTAAVPNGSFDRVAYYLQLDGNFAAASFNAAGFTTVANKTGIPNVASGEYYQQLVTGLNVTSNVGGVVNGTNIATGNIEFWPSNYNQSNPLAIPGANAAGFDFGDGGSNTSNGYGSMQIHNHGAAQTVIAYNRWGTAGGNSDLGIGNRPATVDTDWTFAQNANTIATKNLYVLVRPKEIGTPGNDNITLKLVNGLIQYQIAGAPGPVVVSSTAPLVINGMDGNDTLTVDYSGGNPIPTGGLTFNGGNPTVGPGDKLIISGGTFTNAIFNHTNSSDGSVVLDGNVINYTGLEPVDTTGTTITNLVINLPDTDDATDDVTTLGIVAGSLIVDSVNGEHEDDLISLTGITSITVNGRAGDDVITLLPTMSAFAGSITIEGGANVDDINLNAALSPTTNDLTVTGETIDVDPVAITTTTGNQTFNGLLGLTGSTLTTSGGSVVLGGDVTVGGTAVSTIAGNLNLGGVTRTFTVADAVAGAAVDLNVTAITSNGGITKAGAGTLALTGTNTYAGPMTINAGTVSANSSAALGDGSATNTLIFNGGTLLAAAAINSPAARGVIINAGGATIDTNTFTVTIGGVVSGSGNLTKANTTGSLVLNGNNSGFTGNIVVNRGNLTAGNANALGDTVGTTTLNNTADSGGTGTTLTLSGGFVYAAESLIINTNSASDRRGALVSAAGNNTWTGSITPQGSGPAQLYANGTAALIVTGDIAGPTFTGGFNVRGSSTSTASAVNGSLNIPTANFARTDSAFFSIGTVGETYAWLNTQISVGTLQMTAPNVLPATTIVTMGQADASSPILRLNGFDQTIAGLQSNGSNTGTPSVVGGSATLSTLTINNSAAFNYAKRLGGTGTNENNLAVVKAGGGAQTLSGTVANTATGTTTVQNGTLILNKTDNVIAVAGNLTITGGTVQVLAAGQLSNNTNILVNGGTFDLRGSGYRGNAATLTFQAGTVTDGDGIINSQLNLVANSPAAVSIRGGLTIPINIALDTAGVNGITFDATNNGTATFSGSVILANANKTITVNDGTAAVDLQITGSIVQFPAPPSLFGYTKLGAGTLLMSGTNSYQGATNVNAGTLQLQNGAAVSDTAGAVNVALGATLQLLNNETVSSYSGAGDIGVGTNDSLLALGANTLTTTGSAAIANVTTAAGGGIVAGGSITDTDDDNNITGPNVYLQAGTGIGTAIDPIETAVGSIQLNNTTSGVVNILNSNAGALLTVADLRTLGFGARNLGGALTVVNSSPMTIAANVIAAGPVVLTASDSAAAGDDLIVNPGVVIQSTGSTVTLNAGDIATIPATALVAAAGNVVINIDSGDADAGIGGTLNFAADVDAPLAIFNGLNDANGDTFNVRPDQDTGNVLTPIQVFGLTPNANPNGDALVLNISGLGIPTLTLGPGDRNGSFSFGALAAPLTYNNIENVSTNPALPYHLVLDMRFSGYENGAADTILARLDAAGTNLLLDVNAANVFTGPDAVIQSLTIIGSNDNDALTIQETAGGLPRFLGGAPVVNNTGVGGSTSNGSHLNSSADLALETLIPGGTPWDSADVTMHFDGGAGTDSLAVNYTTANSTGYFSDTNDAGNSGNLSTSPGAFPALGTPTLLMSFANIEPLTLSGAGGLVLTDATGTGATSSLTLTDIGPATQIVGNGGFATTTFSGFNAAVVVGGGGAELLDVVSVDNATLTGLTLLGGNTNDLLALGGGDASADTLRVRSLPATIAATLNGNAGSDLFQLFDAGNTIDNIVGQITVDGTDGNVGGNTDTLTIVNTGGASADNAVIGAVNAGVSPDYFIDGITTAVSSDVTFRNIDVLNYTATGLNDTIDGRFVNTTPAHDLNTANLSGWTGADQFLLFTSDQIGGSGPNNTPSGLASGLNSINLFGDFPGNPNGGDGNDTFGATPAGVVGTGATNVGLVVPDSTRMIRPSASTTINIDGGQPTGLAAPLGDVVGDVLNVDISALPNTTPVIVSTFAPGTVVAGGIQPLVWTQIEDINLVDQGKLTNVQMGDLFARTTPGADLVQITRNPTQLNPNQVRLRITATIGNYSASNKTIIYSGASNDVITQSNLTIPAEFYGEAGDDYITGAMNNDWLVGGDGNDRINGSGGDNVIWGDNAPTNPGDLTPQDSATGGDDQLSGLGGNDVFYGSGGNDLVSAGGGNDYVNGGFGNDTLGGDDGDDRVYGGAGNDVMSGHAGNDLLSGGDGDDQLTGSTGNDVILAGTGADKLDGGDGNDLLVSGSVANENSSWTSVASTTTYSAATYTSGGDNDAALLTLLSQWGSASNRSAIGSITHDGANDDLAGGTGDDDFCWETADVLDNFPGLSPNDYNATNMGSDERFGPT